MFLFLWREKQLVLSLAHTSSGTSLADILGTDPSAETTSNETTSTCQTTHEASIKNPIVGSWFRMEAGPEATPPTYEYDEVGVVIEGTYATARKIAFYCNLASSSSSSQSILIVASFFFSLQERRGMNSVANI
jgi:hypothetical protein